MGRPHPSLQGLLLMVTCCACCPVAGAQLRHADDVADESRADASETPVDEHERRDMPAPVPVKVGEVELPSGREIAALTPDDCRRLLDQAEVQFEPVPDDAAPAVLAPVYLLAPVNGVSFSPRNGLSEHGMLDCRLAIALLAWSPALQEAGVVKVEHYSSFRPGARVRGTGKSSGHARALAMDAARFHFEDGRVLDIEEAWEQRERGGAPCPERTDEGEAGHLLRHLVCEAVSRDLFQVVLTPHHDRAHQNHVHLELVPEVDWSYIK